jgi:hypothetical protein
LQSWINLGHSVNLSRTFQSQQHTATSSVCRFGYRQAHQHGIVPCHRGTIIVSNAAGKPTTAHNNGDGGGGNIHSNGSGGTSAEGDSFSNELMLIMKTLTIDNEFLFQSNCVFFFWYQIQLLQLIFCPISVYFDYKLKPVVHGIAKGLPIILTSSELTPNFRDVFA